MRYVGVAANTRAHAPIPAAATSAEKGAANPASNRAANRRRWRVAVTSRAFREKSARAFRRRHAEVTVGGQGGDAAARRALQEALLDEKGLDHVFDRVALLADRRGDVVEADRALAMLDVDPHG